MSKPEATWAALILLLGASPLAGADRVASVVYLEEGVAVVRDSERLAPAEVGIGMEIENYDVVSTDATGLAEIELQGPGAAGGSVKVWPNTAFTLELDRFGTDSSTTVGLLSGTLALKVQKVSGRRTLEVRTELTTMGVRGTSFTVVTGPAGELLVTAAEGEVACRDQQGRELMARPGTAVEHLPGELFRAIPVAVSDLQTFRREWYAGRLSVLKANALRAIRAYAGRYGELSERFRQAYARLMSRREILSKWAREDRTGRTGGRMEAMREKKEMVGALLQLRKVQFVFERVYYRLSELQGYHRQGYGHGQLRPGLSTEEFFARFAGEARELASKMAQVRYAVKLYSARNGGRFPTDLFDEGEEPFTQDADSFFGDRGF